MVRGVLVTIAAREIVSAENTGGDMNKIIVNKEICTGCKLCFKSCFVDVIQWDDQTRKPIEAYPEDCVQCMLCEVNCPVQALRVAEDLPSYQFPRDNILDY
jgi:NAD-dependent dihydropyrimidine dehydrogenase PreA subunit